MHTELPFVSLRVCNYDKHRRVLTMSSDLCGMPRQLFVHSHYTDKTVRFVAVGPEDLLYDQDQWDGEQQVYRPMGDVKNVDHLVIYNC